MPGPLEGIRVVEMGVWVAGPAAAGVLADWGATVVKVEPPDGDPMRGMFLSAVGADLPINPPFELDNRGKRSLAVNLRTEAGRELLRRLVDGADVFVTNMRYAALERMGLGHEELRRSNPRLVYCNVSGYGTQGPDRDRAAYDVGAFWSRAGIALSLVPPGAEPPQQRGGMGDHATGITAAGAICAALVARQRTGQGQFVSTSLLRTGMYILGWDTSIRLRFGYIDPPYERRRAPNPLINCYRARDEKWFWLLGLQGDRHWPDLVRAIGRPELRDDPRFADIKVRRANATDCVQILDAVFGTRTLAEWGDALDAAGMWWAPVQSVSDVVDDPQARATGAFVRVPDGAAGVEMLASPVDFGGTPWEPRSMPPECGQHTEEVLLEMGLDWEQIGALKEKGVIP
jgi:crotonobetainyl-CoA:carnitine CoA-transferase CaiB-like acyl-CoA transferase